VFNSAKGRSKNKGYFNDWTSTGYLEAQHEVRKYRVKVWKIAMLSQGHFKY
jgi:hypothetical protein